MLAWNDVLNFAGKGNPEPDQVVTKTEQEWRELLTGEAYRVTREQGTEPAFSSGMCSLLEPGLYSCVCCDTLLFDASEKFESGTGWPSFTQPIKANAIAYHSDGAHGMQRIETRCNTCQAHLGHVFPDGPEPSGLRYCMNAVALKKVKGETEIATFGGGCFWCTEAIFQQLRGIEKVESGYSGGETENPTYPQVCSGKTGHAEVIQLTFDPAIVSYGDLLRIHLSTHNPTTLNQQGADRGTQYRSVILANSAEQQAAAESIIEEMKSYFDHTVVTEIQTMGVFYKAEDEHQDYYRRNTSGRYCQAVINPKLEKFRKLFNDKLS